MAMEVPWVICEYPTEATATEATAEEAGMSLAELEEFLFGAGLLHWDAEAAKMRRIADVFDTAREVRGGGEGTDVTLSLAGPTGAHHDGRRDMPRAEGVYSPVAD